MHVENHRAQAFLASDLNVKAIFRVIRQVVESFGAHGTHWNILGTFGARVHLKPCGIAAHFLLVHYPAMPYRMRMHTVAETHDYLIAAKDAGMTADERDDVAALIGVDPTAGAIMPGCGGARKLRYAKPGKGKSGGYRIITYFGGDDIPVFLITVFGKGEKDNLTQAERNEVAKLCKRLRDTYNAKEG